jgi:hypothetical protein
VHAASIVIVIVLGQEYSIFVPLLTPIETVEIPFNVILADIVEVELFPYIVLIPFVLIFALTEIYGITPPVICKLTFSLIAVTFSYPPLPNITLIFPNEEILVIIPQHPGKTFNSFVPITLIC